MDILLNYLVQFCSNNTTNLRHLPQGVVLYPQNGDRIVTMDSLMSLHPMYKGHRKQKSHQRLVPESAIWLIVGWPGESVQLVQVATQQRCFCRRLEHRLPHSVPRCCRVSSNPAPMPCGTARTRLIKVPHITNHRYTVLDNPSADLLRPTAADER